MLHQQAWCFGADIRNGGNILYQNGYERLCGPDDSRMYAGIYKQAEIRLWAFGFAVSMPEHISYGFQRYDHRPRKISKPTEIWSGAAFKHQSRPLSKCEISNCTMPVKLLFEAFADYENRISANNGSEYRRAVLQAWKHKSIPAPRIAETWLHLSAMLTGLACKHAGQENGAESKINGNTGDIGNRSEYRPGHHGRIFS